MALLHWLTADSQLVIDALSLTESSHIGGRNYARRIKVSTATQLRRLMTLRTQLYADSALHDDVDAVPPRRRLPRCDMSRTTVRSARPSGAFVCS
jgi:hypothetical protein